MVLAELAKLQGARCPCFSVLLQKSKRSEYVKMGQGKLRLTMPRHKHVCEQELNTAPVHSELTRCLPGRLQRPQNRVQRQGRAVGLGYDEPVQVS